MELLHKGGQGPILVHAPAALWVSSAKPSPEATRQEFGEVLHPLGQDYYSSECYLSLAGLEQKASGQGISNTGKKLPRED